MTPSAQPPWGLYVHVPFCRTKCRYCTFFSITHQDLVSPYVDAVLVELKAAGAHPFATLYFGGGTPSCLPLPELERLVAGVREASGAPPGAEVTVELNPDDATASLMSLLVSWGINRVSIGVQSLWDDELAFLGRRHTAQQAAEAIVRAREAGLGNVNVDLIYGFRGHRRSRWEATLERVCAWRPEHVSCYQLTLEEGSPLARAGVGAASEAKEAAFFLVAHQVLTAHGYEHYEVSNYALPGYACRHNVGYWARMPSVGLGPSAHSFDGARRWWNVSSVAEYVRRVGAGICPAEGGETLGEEEHLLETLMLGCRTRLGIPWSTIRQLPRGEEVASRLVAMGLVEARDRLVPTVRGMLLADRIPLAFFPPYSQPLLLK